MKLVLYSGGERTGSEALDRELLRLTGKRRPSLTYIPSSSDYGIWEFGEFVHHFRQYHLSRLIYFPVDVPSSDALIREAFSQDIVFLSGGNTFYFLHHLRAGGYLPRLREFVSRGGVLAGLSAGAIIMTSTIETAGFPEFDRDENAVGLRDLRSLGLVDLEFFPHFVNSRRYRDALSQYSAAHPRPLFACPDGSGLVVKDLDVRIIGKALVFLEGKPIWQKQEES